MAGVERYTALVSCVVWEMGTQQLINAAWALGVLGHRDKCALDTMAAIMEVLLAGSLAGRLSGTELVTLLWSQAIMRTHEWRPTDPPRRAPNESHPGLDEGVAAMGTVVEPPSSTERLGKQLKRCCQAAQLTAAEIATAAWSLRRLGCTDRALLDAVVEAAEARIDEFDPDQEAMLLSAVSALLPPGAAVPAGR